MIGNSYPCERAIEIRRMDPALFEQVETDHDLGGRTLDVLPAPVHEPSHIFLYDRVSEILLTGNTLYPGLLVVNDWQAYVRSIGRLLAFAQAHPVSFVLGAHVEMTNVPRRWFGLGVLFQPGEHPLPLELRHLVELDDASGSVGARAANTTDTRGRGDLAWPPAAAAYSPPMLALAAAS